MTNPIKGTVAAISNYGVGKTTFALECGYHPKDIIFINDDIKDTGIEPGEFKRYIDLTSASSGLKLLEFHQACSDIIDNLPGSEVIIWDTWTRYAGTFGPYVIANSNEFRPPSQYSSKGQIKKGEQYQDAYIYEGQQITKLKNKCDLLIITFHLKQFYMNNQPVLDKMKPGHDRAIEKYADLRIWLTLNPDSQYPIGLVLKNISRRVVTNQGIKTQRVFPLRIPCCTWQNILGYWEHPMGNRKPTPEEMPNAFELGMIEGILTPEEKQLFGASLLAVERQENEAQLIEQEQEEIIKEWIKENCNDLPIPVLANKINEAIEAGELVYDGEINKSKISEWSK